MTTELLKLLIIDDEEDLAQMLADYLEMEFHTTVVTNPSEAINAITNNTYDLIITDLHMPEISGFEIIRKVKSIQPKTPILVMTGNGRDDPETKKALDLGAVDVVVKPFSGLGQLLIMLKSIIEKSKD